MNDEIEARSKLAARVRDFAYEVKSENPDAGDVILTVAGCLFGRVENDLNWAVVQWANYVEYPRMWNNYLKLVAERAKALAEIDRLTGELNDHSKKMVAERAKWPSRVESTE